MQELQAAQQAVVKAQCALNAAEARCLSTRQAIRTTEAAHKKAALEASGSQLPAIKRELQRLQHSLARTTASEQVWQRPLRLLSQQKDSLAPVMFGKLLLNNVFTACQTYRCYGMITRHRLTLDQCLCKALWHRWFVRFSRCVARLFGVLPVHPST